MDDRYKTRQQLMDDLQRMHTSVAELNEIIDKLRTEKTPFQSERHYRALVDNAPIGILVSDTLGNILEVNRACLEILGSPGPEATKSINMLTFPALVNAGISGAFSRCMTEGKPTIYDTQYTSKWGKQSHLRLILAPMLNKDDEVEGCQAVMEDITERKKTEEALRQSLRRLEESQRIGKIGTWEWNSVTGATYWSDETYRIFGLEPGSEIPSYELAKRLTLPADTDMWSKTVQECLESNGKLKLDYRSLRQDGAVIWIHNEGDVIRDNDGATVGMFGTVQDTTEFRAIEESLKESEKIKALALDTTQELFVCYDRELNIIWANKASCDSADLSPEAIVNKRCHEIWQDRTEPCEGCPVLLALQTGRPQISYDISSSDGRNWFIRAYPLFDSDGNIQGVVEIGLDVSTRHKAEQALKESEDRYRQLAENSLTGIFIHQDGVCVYANQRMSDILGYKSEEVIGASILDGLLPPDDRDMARSMALGRIKGQLPPSAYELRLLKKSGEEISCQVLAAMINFQGKPAIMGNVYDITECRKLELQLIQSQKMQAVGTLAAGIAHDFNNMLQIILGYTDLMMLGNKTGLPDYEPLRKIKKTVMDARDLVQKIRIFSKKADIRPVPVNLNDQVQQVVNILSHSLARQIVLDIDLANHLAIINADPGLIDQMIMNLAINAGEAMPEGGRLTIRTMNVFLDDDFCRLNLGLNPGPHVMLTIADTGKGIPRELLDRIFDPFYSTKARDYNKGTGLGLPVVQGIVEQHRGVINIESKPGKGTVFTIYFPALENSEMVSEPPLPNGRNETILVVDDEESVRYLIKDLLEQFDYTVLTAGDGQQAVEVYERFRDKIDLVLLDVIMPRLDGKRCLVKLLEKNPHAKVLIFSGVSEDYLIRDIVNLGAKGSLIKPLDMKAMLRKIRQVLDAS